MTSNKPFLLLVVLLLGCNQNSTKSFPNDRYMFVGGDQRYAVSLRVVDEHEHDYVFSLKITNNTQQNFPDPKILNAIASISLNFKDKDGFFVESVNIGMPVLLAAHSTSIDELYKMSKRKYASIDGVYMTLNAQRTL